MTSVVKAKVQGPMMEVLERNDYAVLYRERFGKGYRLVYRHYLSACDYFSDVIYIDDDGFLWVYHMRGRNREDYLSEFLDSESTQKIRDAIMSVKTFEDFAQLLDRLLKTTFCKSEEKPWLYRLCS
jgi:hypothetical protein